MNGNAVRGAACGAVGVATGAGAGLALGRNEGTGILRTTNDCTASTGSLATSIPRTGTKREASVGSGAEALTVRGSCFVATTWGAVAAGASEAGIGCGAGAAGAAPGDLATTASVGCALPTRVTREGAAPAFELLDSILVSEGTVDDGCGIRFGTTAAARASIQSCCLRAPALRRGDTSPESLCPRAVGPIPFEGILARTSVPASSRPRATEKAARRWGVERRWRRRASACGRIRPLAVSVALSETCRGRHGKFRRTPDLS
jgi:hypothetical protein